MKTMRNRLRRMTGRWFIALACVLMGVTAHATVRTWTGLADGQDWFLAGNWSPDSDSPQSGESVVITNGTVLLDSDSAWLNSLTISNATLMFTNWTTRLQATNVTVQPNATLRPARGFLETEMSNRVYIVCSNLVIESDGRIFADALGYRAEGTNVAGPGKGGSSSSRGAGGSYGGMGGRTAVARPVYGATNAPTDPGSTGGFGHSPSPGAGDGGGAIRIIADSVLVNGSITANGGNSGTYGGGGSGGGIYITCNTLAATGGVLHATGGNAVQSNSGNGGGGRIAVDCTQFIHPVDIDVSVLPGDANRLPGEMGTVYLPDTGLLTETLSQFSGVRLVIPDFTAWTVTNLTVTSGPLGFEDPVFTLNVASNLTVLSNAWFCLGAQPLVASLGYANGFNGGTTNPVVLIGGDLRLDQGILTLGGDRQDAISRLTIGNDLILTNAAQLHVYPGQSNTLHRYGGYVSVTGKTTVAAGAPSWIMPHSHAQYGSAVLFNLDELDVQPDAGFNADDKGFAWIGTSCYAPSYGASAGSRGAGSGHGGAGGNISVAGGSPYGLTNAPILPGAPGGYGHSTGFAQPGGGAIRIHASTVTLGGVIKSSQTLGNGYGGGGGGGGIFITCDTFSGAATGVLRADGGNGGTSGTPQGGGGGGRIAAWTYLQPATRQRVLRHEMPATMVGSGTHPAFLAADVSVNGGSGYQNGELGTIRFLMVRGTLFKFR